MKDLIVCKVRLIIFYWILLTSVSKVTLEESKAKIILLEKSKIELHQCQETLQRERQDHEKQGSHLKHQEEDARQLAAKNVCLAMHLMTSHSSHDSRSH